MKKWLKALKTTGSEWSDHGAPRLAASLSYYTLLSVAPLSLLCVAVVGFFFGEEAARGQIATQLSATTGPEAANAIQNVVRNAHQSDAGLLSTIAGIVMALVGASGVFGELQTALNTMWGVKPKPDRGWKGFIRDRFLSFTMVLAVAFILLASLAVSAGLSTAGKYLSDSLPGGAGVWQVVNFLISLGVITGLFTLIFKVVPDAEMRWRDAAVGGFATAVLFTIGKLLLGLYLGRSSVGSAYGAAGSIVAFVVWVYYAAQILFLGAEFTRVYANEFGKPITPSDNAIPVDAPSTQASDSDAPPAAARARDTQPAHST